MLAIGRALLLASLLAMAMIAGFFYAYGCSVLLGLDELPPGEAIRAMQAINRRVRNVMFAPSFFGALAGTAATLVVYASLRHWRPVAWLALALALYGLGAFLVTVGFNVPLNRALALVDTQGAADLANLSRDYFTPWNFWNWVRTGASLAAVAALAMAWRADGGISTGRG